MVVRCYEDGVLPSLIDGSELQLASLEWMQKYRIEKMPHKSYNDNNFDDFYNSFKKIALENKGDCLTIKG